MPEYQIADGHNNAAGFTSVTPQPKCPGMLPASLEPSISGHEAENGSPYTLWMYSVLTVAQFNALNTAFGVSRSARSNDVTVSTREDARTFGSYNGTIHYPEMGRDAKHEDSWYRDVEYRITMLEPVS